MKEKFELVKRERRIKVRGEIIKFEETVKIDLCSKEAVYDRELEIKNTENLYRIYREKKGMSSVEEIIEIRETYGLNQSDFSLILGLGKVTIHRYENGMLQTEANDTIIKLSKDIHNMKKLIDINGNKLSQESLESLRETVDKLVKIEEHKKLKNEDLVELKELDDFEEISVKDVAKKIIFMGNQKGIEITPLKLQKLIYYVKGIALAILGKQVFKEKVVNWAHGPVVEEVYHEYKSYGKNPITCIEDVETSDSLIKLIDKILQAYGECGAYQLVNLTHEEDPWVSTNKNQIIEDEKICEYFRDIYCN